MADDLRGDRSQQRSEQGEPGGGAGSGQFVAEYTVDPFVRTPPEIVDALFREKTDAPRVKRPETVGKAIVGYLVRTDEDGHRMPSDIQAFT